MVFVTFFSVDFEEGITVSDTFLESDNRSFGTKSHIMQVSHLSRLNSDPCLEYIHTKCQLFGLESGSVNENDLIEFNFSMPTIIFFYISKVHLIGTASIFTVLPLVQNL